MTDPQKPPDHRSANQIDITIGQKLRAARVLSGLSQQALADALGITFQQLQKYERGKNRIVASRLFLAAHVLAVPIQFFDGDETLPQTHADLAPMPDDVRAIAKVAAEINDPVLRKHLLALLKRIARTMPAEPIGA